jgi:hypothetical protein
LSERENDDIEKQLGVLALPSEKNEKKLGKDQRLCETIKQFCVKCKLLGDINKFRESLECFCGGVKFVVTVCMFVVGWQCGELGWIVIKLWGMVELISECMVDSFCCFDILASILNFKHCQLRLANMGSDSVKKRSQNRNQRVKTLLLR